MVPITHLVRFNTATIMVTISIVWRFQGNQVVIPAAVGQAILEELHESHQEASIIKGRARIILSL